MDNNINDNLGFGGGLFFDDDELNAGPVSNDTHMPGASIAADSDEEDWGDIDSDDDGPGRKSPTNPIKRRVEKGGKRDHSADSNGPVARKKLKVKGGRAAVPKKVVANMDTDDEIIVTMKQNRCVDAEIAERLINEGRTRYDVKTIASRWQRLRRVLAERQDELLDDDLTDWHMGEDDALEQAYKDADDMLNAELAKVYDRRWRFVAMYLRRKIPTSKYSARACKERFEALQNGTARCPPELDENPEARRAERDAKLAERQRVKEEAARVKAEAAEAARLAAEKARIEAEKVRQEKAAVRAKSAMVKASTLNKIMSKKAQRTATKNERNQKVEAEKIAKEQKRTLAKLQAEALAAAKRDAIQKAKDVVEQMAQAKKDAAAKLKADKEAQRVADAKAKAEREKLASEKKAAAEKARTEREAAINAKKEARAKEISEADKKAKLAAGKAAFNKSKLAIEAASKSRVNPAAAVQKMSKGKAPVCPFPMSVATASTATTPASNNHVGAVQGTGRKPKVLGSYEAKNLAGGSTQLPTTSAAIAHSPATALSTPSAYFGYNLLPANVSTAIATPTHVAHPAAGGSNDVVTVTNHGAEPGSLSAEQYADREFE
ncbi:hypothetical protein B0A49_06707 [Cryomyces minteri]|uniref:DUF7626 domain-containing protein n=1 Tax=Cryomyces minteri TaxID=331657 RepID=A0A4U0X287_9PEZI|nr:hypothetical protein B0A49_06707 [Cryomyces minteri]